MSYTACALGYPVFEDYPRNGQIRCTARLFTYNFFRKFMLKYEK